MKTAILYAGQGSQHAGMGKDFYEASETFRKAFDAAELSFDLHEMCFEDPNGLLSQTEYTQPCMTAFAMGVTAMLKEKNVQIDYAAGLSLGEYSALSAAGVLDPKETVETVAFRGKAMKDAAEGIDCGMTAVMNLEEDKLQECCDKASSEGVVSICNFNCPGQLVISGEKKAVDAASALASEAGARRCIPLKVSGPFHTSLMSPAGDKLKKRFESLTFNPMQIPVMFNYLGREITSEDLGGQDVTPESTSKAVPELLVQQVQKSVRMEMIIRRMIELGVDTFIEVGPGKTLSGFVKKTAKAVGTDAYRTFSIDTLDDFNAMIAEL
ncbi:[acyl-carrier-protein] S-malonyltransferase [Lachnospiraceae bacterium]|nr:[acyl-carrier-protein] S-malonyltransferase [Lachnospiraceae bacterium]